MIGTTEVRCRCGQVRLAVTGAPMLSAKCHCSSCRTAAKRLQTLPGGETIVEADGGTPFTLYRKDRVQFIDGTEYLAEFRLTRSSPTRRVVAVCCNSPMFLEFEHGHWLSIYSDRWPDAERPQPDIRTMTKDMPDGPALPQNIPYGRWQTLGFYGKLLTAWVAMGFRTPNLPQISAKVEV